MAKKNEEPVDKEHIELCSDVKQILKTPGGRNVIWNILAMCDLYSDVFTGDNHTFYLEGKRSVGLEILQMMEDADPTGYARLLLTKQKEKSND